MKSLGFSGVVFISTGDAEELIHEDQFWQNPKCLRGSSRSQNRELSTTRASVLLEQASGLIIILVAYKALINTL